MKILINTPTITSPAGVSSHYLGLKPYFSNNVIYNRFFTSIYFKRKISFWILEKTLGIVAIPYDYVKFTLRILWLQKPTVLLNPSFASRAIKRDLVYLRVAKLLGCKVGVFFHGWDRNYLDEIFRGEIKFDSIWQRGDAFFVLAHEFKNYLKKLGIKTPIYTTTTKVNDQLLENVSTTKNFTKVQNILFLARIEKAKGIYITIDAFEILVNEYPSMQLQIVGGGEELNSAKEYVANKKLMNVTFTGPLFGDKLKARFLEADLYILPTHGEGMPTSVLEAMAFGLPVITRPVGGLVDFFENDKMGYLVDSLEPKKYALKIIDLVNNIEKVNQISHYNSKYVRNHFLASKVAVDLENKLYKL